MKDILQFIKNFYNKGLEYFHLYYSYYPAVVVDNEDPGGLNRLTLKIPEITGNLNFEQWISPKNEFSGTGFGIKITPQIGDTVFVEFEKGSIYKPRWVHGYKIKADLPKEEYLKSPNVYWFITPKGYRFEVNEEDDSITIKLGDSYINLQSDVISLVTDKISLGSKEESSEPAVLGNRNEQAWKTLENILSTQGDMLKVLSDTAAAASQGPLAVYIPFFSGLSTLLVSQKTQLQLLSQQTENLNSEKITLN